MPIEVLLEKPANPAHRAILTTGVNPLEQLSAITAEQVAGLHGLGKNARR